MTGGLVAILHTGTVAAPLLRWARTLPRDVDLFLVEGNQIARQRNMAIEAVTGAGAEWVLFLDSDCLPPFDALPRLRALEVPIASAIVCERYPPWRPTAVRSLDPPVRWALADLPGDGPLQVAATGAGCLLVRRAVWETLSPPWFRCGQIVQDLLLEDTEFCLRASHAGIPTVLDCGVRVGHRIAFGTVWPGRDGRHWMEYSGPGDIRVPLDVTEPEPALTGELTP